MNDCSHIQSRLRRSDGCLNCVPGGPRAGGDLKAEGGAAADNAGEAGHTDEADHADHADGAAGLRLRLGLVAASGLFWVTGLVLRWIAAPVSGGGPRPGAAALALGAFVLSAVFGGWLAAGEALHAVAAGRVDFEVLVIAAAAGAFVIGDAPEAALVLLLFSVGEALETLATLRTRRAVGSLLDLVPRTALVRKDGVEREIPCAEVAVGDLVIVRPGERCPVDGTVVSGSSFCDEAALTGEPVPVPKNRGDGVFAGSVNGSGTLEVLAGRRAEESTLAQTLRLVEAARRSKARRQKVIDRFAASYTPTVAGLAAALGLVVPMVLGRPFAPYLYRSLALLLVACPCALVLSTPVAVVAAVGNAARRGVLIKSGAALEAIGRVRAVAFDKTGTLTVGRPEVEEVVVAPDARSVLGDGAADEVSALIALAAAVELRSDHPVAEAIRRKASSLGSAPEIAVSSAHETLAGRGARATVAGRPLYLGSETLFTEELGVRLGELAERGARLEAEGKTVVYLGATDRVLGLIAVSDILRPEAPAAVAELRRAGVERVYLLTGDNPAAAGRAAAALGLDGFRARLLPAGKAAAVRELAGAAGGAGGRRAPVTLAMVGDGINDAPALAAADVGVAMGAAGSDQAVEAADIALLSDDLGRVAYTVRLGRRAAAVIRQNIALALAIKAAALVLAAAGLLPLWLAVLADTGNTVLVIANGLRLLGSRAEDGGRGPGRECDRMHAPVAPA